MFYFHRLKTHFPAEDGLPLVCVKWWKWMNLKLLKIFIVFHKISHTFQLTKKLLIMKKKRNSFGYPELHTTLHSDFNKIDLDSTQLFTHRLTVQNVFSKLMSQCHLLYFLLLYWLIPYLHYINSASLCHLWKQQWVNCASALGHFQTSVPGLMNLQWTSMEASPHSLWLSRGTVSIDCSVFFLHLQRYKMKDRWIFTSLK